MAYSLEDLEQARRHVAEGEQHIATLSNRIARDRFTGRPTRLVHFLICVPDRQSGLLF
jgi:hypothetical protein